MKLNWGIGLINAWLCLVGTMLLPGMGVASAVLVYLIFKSPSEIERTTSYHVGDLVMITYQGQKRTQGRIGEITPLSPGQLPLARIATIGVKFDRQGNIYRDNVKMPLWQIKGRVTRRFSANVHDTAYHLALEQEWLLYGPPRKERVG